MSLEEFFTAIKDKTWHNIEELSDKLNLQPAKLMELSDFLSQHGLLNYEREGNKIRLNLKWRLLISEEKSANRFRAPNRHLIPQPRNAAKKPKQPRIRSKPESKRKQLAARS
jgi:hypothetical protein